MESIVRPAVVLLFISSLTTSKLFGNKCSMDRHTLHCNGTIPDRIPNDVKELWAADENKEQIHAHVPNSMFKDHSWGNLLTVDITIDVRSVLNCTFCNLKRLELFGFHSFHLEHIQKSGLSGLRNLKRLDLSGCVSLDTKTLVYGLMSVAMPHLRTLNLAYMSATGDMMFQFDYGFVRMLKSRHIVYLRLKGSVLLLTGLERTNFETPLMHLDLSNIIVLYRPNKHISGRVLYKLFASLITLNISHVPLQTFNVDYRVLQDRMDGIYTKRCDNFFSQIHNVFLDYVFEGSYLSVTNSTYDATNCTYNLTRLSLRGNRLKIINATYLWPRGNHVEEIMLSFNYLEYLSPSVFTHLSNLTKLDLSNNKFFKMASSAEFEHLLYFLPLINAFNFSFNKLTRIPEHMFLASDQLQVLDLSNNLLRNINFKLNHLYKLQIINVSRNHILYLSEITVLHFLHLIKLNAASNKSLSVYLYGNPLKCSCASVEFVKYMAQTQPPETDGQYRCALEDKSVTVTSDTVKEAQYLCIKQKVTVSWSVSVSVSLVFFTILILYTTKKIQTLRKKARKRNFVRNFVNGLNIREKWIAFLSYNADNVDNEHEEEIESLTTHLSEGLKDAVGSNESVLCYPDKDFRVGLSEYNEISRCVEESCVVLIFISHRSETNLYVNTTFDIAKYLAKPVIVVARNDREYETKFVRDCLKKNTTVTLIGSEQGYVPDKGWNNLFDMIVSLATEHDKNHKRT